METLNTLSTFQKICAAIEKNYAEEAKQIRFQGEIYALLVEKFNGKHITQRLCTAIKKLHPTWVVCLDKASSQTYLRAWGGDSGFVMGDQVRVFLGYDEDLISYNPDKFITRNGIEFANKRQQKRSELLDNPIKIQEIACAIDEYTKVRSRLVALIDNVNVDDNYSLEVIAGLRK